MSCACQKKGPSAEQVQRRALALAYLGCRAMIDGDPRAREMGSKILKFVGEAGISEALEPWEARLLKAKFGTLSEFERAETSWLVEGMTVLAWALGKAELPLFGERCSAARVSVALGMFKPGAQARVEDASLRSIDEIEIGALRYLALNLRIGRYIERPEKVDFAASLRELRGQHLLVDGLELRDGDLTIDGRELGQVPPERFREVFSIVRQRFHAFNWVRGYAPRYAVDTSVQ